MLLRSLSVALVLAPLSVACSDDSSDEPGHPSENIDDVVFVGGTTDEALAQLLDRPVKDVARERLVIDSPGASARLPASEPATFAFRAAASGSLDRTRVRALDDTPPSFRSRAWTELQQLFGPVRAAHAHGTPYSGTAYFLVLEDADGNAVLRIFTGQTSYTPDSAAWLALEDVPQPLELSIVSAFFEENDIPADGGPFAGASVAFEVVATE